jgi:hypothetical protein
MTINRDTISEVRSCYLHLAWFSGEVSGKVFRCMFELRNYAIRSSCWT